MTMVYLHDARKMQHEHFILLIGKLVLGSPGKQIRN